MRDVLFGSVLRRLEKLLDIEQLCYIDDPVLIYGQSMACAILHECADVIVNEYNECTVQELDELLCAANTVYEEIKVQNKILAIGFISTVTSALSKIYINRVGATKKIGIVIPVYNEVERIAQQNALNARIEQYIWLFSNRVISNQHLLFVDDMSTDNTPKLLRRRLELLPQHYRKEISAISLEEIDSNKYKHYKCVYPALNYYPNSIKGGSVYFGLLWMLHEKYDYVLCIDFDLTFSIEHLGVLLNELLKKSHNGVVINSKRKEGAKGYLHNREANMVSLLFQTINNELLCSNFTDCNSGCKMIKMDFFAEVANEITDVDLSLDAELLMLCLRNGYQVVENAAVCFHKYEKGKQGVDRDYGKMLKRINQSKVMHNYNLNLATPMYNEMVSIGFYPFVQMLENNKRPQDTNLQTLFRYFEEEIL